MSTSHDYSRETFNAADYFVDRHRREGRATRIAIECEDQRVTYAQLAERVNRLGNGLRDALQVRMEERVLLLLPDIPEFAYCFFGAIKIGAVPVPLNTLLRSTDYEFLSNDTRARVAVTTASLLHLIQQIPRDRLPFLKHIIVVGAVSPNTIEATYPAANEYTLSFSDLLASHSADLTSAPTCADDVAFWLYSSGSTGAPKACVHLQHDMVAATDQYARNILRIRESDRFFSAAKLFFAYGLGNALYFPLAVGATSILWPGPPSAQNIFSAIERHRPTLFFSAPSICAAMLDFPGRNRIDPINASREGTTSVVPKTAEFSGVSTPEVTRPTVPGISEMNSKDFDLSSIRLGASAGEALPASLSERFSRRFGFEILDGIGSTEALHIFISNSPGNVRHGSSGRAVPGCEVKILDDQGQPVRPGEIGTLWVKSDAVCSAYWNRHQRTKQTIQGHWICTGDKFHQDPDGYYWFDGRDDDMLKVSGVWVSPAEIESVLTEHPAVAEVAVTAHKDKDGLTKPVAWIVLRPAFVSGSELGGSELAAQLQEFVVSRLPAYKRPRHLQFVLELPKTATGKIQRFKLRQSRLHL